MRRRRIFLIIAGCALTTLLLIVLWPSEPEPYYQGKSLSEWLVQFRESEASDATQEAGNAIQAIGTNALPFILKWIAYERPAWKNRYYSLTAKLPGPIARLFGRLVQEPKVEAKAAAESFQVLRDRASPAIQELSRLLRDSKSQEVREIAVDALRSVGQEGMPTLIAGLTNRQSAVRSLAASQIGAMATSGFNVSAAVPSLIECVRDQDERVSSIALWALSDVTADPDPKLSSIAQGYLSGIDPEKFTPYFLPGLKDSRWNVRLFSVGSLAKLGPGAHAAVPALIKTLEDADGSVRTAATNALLKISPESLTNTAPSSATGQK